MDKVPAYIPTWLSCMKSIVYVTVWKVYTTEFVSPAVASNSSSWWSTYLLKVQTRKTSVGLIRGMLWTLPGLPSAKFNRSSTLLRLQSVSYKSLLLIVSYFFPFVDKKQHNEARHIVYDIDEVVLVLLWGLSRYTFSQLLMKSTCMMSAILRYA